VPLKYRALVQRLREHGVKEEMRRGGTGHRMFVREGPPRITYPWSWHGDNEDMPDSWIKAVCRRFGIDFKQLMRRRD